MSHSPSQSLTTAPHVSLTLTHMPLPGALGQLLDLASLGVAALADFGKG